MCFKLMKTQKVNLRLDLFLRLAQISMLTLLCKTLGRNSTEKSLIHLSNQYLYVRSCSCAGDSAINKKVFDPGSVPACWRSHTGPLWASVSLSENGIWSLERRYIQGDPIHNMHRAGVRLARLSWWQEGWCWYNNLEKTAMAPCGPATHPAA